MSFTSRSPTLFSLWTSEEKPLPASSRAKSRKRGHFKTLQALFFVLFSAMKAVSHGELFYQSLIWSEGGQLANSSPLWSSYLTKEGKNAEKNLWRVQGHRPSKRLRPTHRIIECFPQHTLHPLLQTQDYRRKNCKAQILHRKEILGKHKHNREAKNKDNWWDETSDTYSYSRWRNSWPEKCLLTLNAYLPAWYSLCGFSSVINFGKFLISYRKTCPFFLPPQ